MQDRSLVIFHNGKVLVTRTLLSVGSTSYPIAGIGSVSVISNSSLIYYITAAGSAFFAAGSGWDGSLEQGLQGPIFLLIASLALFVVGINRKSILVIRTASGDQKALESKSIPLLLAVKRAIEQAVAERG